jgi:hypothetical protein
MATLTEDRVRTIVREETDSLRLGVRRVGVLGEETSKAVKTIGEKIDTAIAQRKTVDDHGKRIGALEVSSADTREAVKAHSQRITDLEKGSTG